jgi:tRNA pseudouridine55 synthase
MIVSNQAAPSDVDGILNLNKPKGWTSHDVVARVRRLTGVRRVGHAGTLDPMATGVLLICLGKATRIAEYLVAGRKRYSATLRLGISTDSHDADGRVTAEAPVTADLAAVEEALSRFRGPIEQVPPMISAIKKDGQRLYELARRGVEVERPPRAVEIYGLHLVDWAPPKLTIDVTCSSGTYIRAIARDLGRDLGCGAHLTALTRTASGDFTLTDAIELATLVDAVVGKDDPATSCQNQVSVKKNALSSTPLWHALVMPLEAGLSQFPACALSEEASESIRHGQPLPEAQVDAPRDQLCRAYSAADRSRTLLALLKFDGDIGFWRPHKVFQPG